MKFCKLFLLLIIGQYSFAGSQYPGKYICNNEQIIQVTSSALKISNAVFKHQSTSKKAPIIDVYTIDDQLALFSLNTLYKSKGRYSLTIRTIKSFKKDVGFEFVGSPYVGDCVAVK